MARKIDTVRQVQTKKRIGGNFGAEIAVVAHALIGTDNKVKLDPDDMVTNLTNLLASTGAAAAVSTLITGTDLTVSGTLTTLATNVGAHTTQGTTLAVALQSLIKIVTPLTPSTGFSQNLTILSVDEILNLTPAGTLATGTIVFPSNANSRIGQVLTVVSHQIITALTVTASALTVNGTAVTALAVDTPVSWVKIAASTWQRLL